MFLHVFTLTFLAGGKIVTLAQSVWSGAPGIATKTEKTHIMKSANDPFAEIREAETSAPNFDLDTEAIIAELRRWQTLCTFSVTAAGTDRIEIEFATLPKAMDAFVRDLYDFCPDLVDQGTGCMAETIEAMKENGEELTPEMEELIEGVDFEDIDYGLEILKRELRQKKSVSLWWD